MVFPTSTPKPRAEGSSPSAPAIEKSQKPLWNAGSGFFCRSRHGLMLGVEAPVLGVIFASGAVRF